MNRLALKAQYHLAKGDGERQSEFFAYAIYRPLSFLVTPLFLRAGFSANGVSLLAMVLALAMPVVAVTAVESAYLWLAGITFSCLVLDCVDGNVARSRQSCGLLGRYVDSIGGKAYQLLLHLALALVAAGEVPEVERGYWLSIALLAVLLHMWARESRAYAKLYIFENQELFRTTFGLKQIAASLPDLTPFGLLVFGTQSGVYLLLCGLALLSIFDFSYTQRIIFRRILE